MSHRKDRDFSLEISYTFCEATQHMCMHLCVCLCVYAHMCVCLMLVYAQIKTSLGCK